jgi:hypothetical protein
MYNYLICKTQQIYDIQGNDLGSRVCDVSESTFPVSDDYEWKEYAEYFDVYTGSWYWADKPTEYVAPAPEPQEQPVTEGTQDL